MMLNLGGLGLFDPGNPAQGTSGGLMTSANTLGPIQGVTLDSSGNPDYSNTVQLIDPVTGLAVKGVSTSGGVSKGGAVQGISGGLMAPDTTSAGGTNWLLLIGLGVVAYLVFGRK